MAKDTVFRNDIQEIAKLLSKKAAALEGKTLLITGGSGFIGTYIINTIIYLNEHTFKKPCKIISVDNFITSSDAKKKSKIKTPHVTFIEHDVTKQLSIRGKIDYIIHAAGIASPVYYQKYPIQTIDVAVIGLRNMLELAKEKKVTSFLYFSSSEIYGNPSADAIPTKETYNGNVSSIGPRSCYDESKRLGETFCMTYYRIHNTPVKIVRPFNVFGPGMRPQDYRVIPSFMYTALVGKPIPVHEKGKQTRTFCYATDAIVGFMLVLLSKKNGEVYNVGNDENEITMNQLAKSFVKVFGNKAVIKNIPYPKNYPADEPQRRCPDLTKIRKELGYNPQVSLEAGLARTLLWAKENWKFS